MITLRRLSKLREFSTGPIIITCIDDHASDGSAMPADPFGRRFHHNIGAPLNWSEKVPGCSESIINDQRQVVLFCQFSEFLKVRYIQSGVTNCFQVDSFCVFVNMLYKRFYIVPVCKTNINTQALER